MIDLFVGHSSSATACVREFMHGLEEVLIAFIRTFFLLCILGAALGVSPRFNYKRYILGGLSIVYLALVSPRQTTI